MNLLEDPSGMRYAGPESESDPLVNVWGTKAEGSTADRV
jgi:hypothetical protein